MKLKGLNLEVQNIHRKGIFDIDAIVFCCDNCGRAIINCATVKDQKTGNLYTIGLDCKSALIDKQHIDNINKKYDQNEAKYKIRKYKQAQKKLNELLRFLDNIKNYTVFIDRADYLSVYDMQQTDSFGQSGKCIFNEHLSYLFSIGLKDLLQAAQTKGIIKKI